MASSMSIRCTNCSANARNANVTAAKLATPPGAGTDKDDESPDATDALPQTLVRIPTEHAPVVQAQADAAEASIGDESNLAT